MRSSTTSSSSTTTRANGTQACAACKYQRRKCYPDCILAPYFPHDRQSQFLNAHKLFGVSNITKIIRNLTPPEKDEAMRTIIFQSDVRAADPVGGCCRIIRDLQRQIELGHLELDLVLHQLALCRAAAAAQQASLPNSGVENLSGYDGAISYENMAPPPTAEGEEDDEEFFLQENNGFQEIAAWAMQDTASSCMQEKQQGFLKVDCGDDEDFKPNLLDIAGDRLELAFYHDDDAIEQSDEAISKEERAMLKDEIAALMSSKDDINNDSHDPHTTTTALSLFSLK